VADVQFYVFLSWLISHIGLTLVLLSFSIISDKISKLISCLLISLLPLLYLFFSYIQIQWFLWTVLLLSE